MEKHLPSIPKWTPIFLFVSYVIIMPLLGAASYETTRTIRLAFVVLSSILTILTWIQERPTPNKMWMYAFVLVMTFMVYSLF